MNKVRKEINTVAELRVPKNVAVNIIAQEAEKILGHRPAVWEEDGRTHIGWRDSPGLFKTSQLHVSVGNGNEGDRDVRWHEVRPDWGDQDKKFVALRIALGQGWDEAHDTGAMK